jgi:hypothetical protein
VIELVQSSWRVFDTAFDVIASGQTLGVIAQGRDGLWSVWHPAGSYVQGHLESRDEAAEIAAQIRPDRFAIAGITS